MVRTTSAFGIRLRFMRFKRDDTKLAEIFADQAKNEKFVIRMHTEPDSGSHVTTAIIHDLCKRNIYEPRQFLGKTLAPQQENIRIDT